jgi:hypothetical protein
MAVPFVTGFIRMTGDPRWFRQGGGRFSKLLTSVGYF